jgi:sarcosine oxidase subunit gamma
MLTRDKVINKNSIGNFNGFNFQELPNIPKINLRGSAADRNFLNNTQRALNIQVPLEPNTSNNNDKLKIIWLSPDEWMIEINEIKDFDKIFSDLKKSLNSENTAITDVTENRTILKLSGDHLYKLLSKFMIIDHEKVLKKESSVAQTIFIKVPVLLIRKFKKNYTPCVFMYVNRSHAQYIIDLLIDGSKNIDF